MSLELTSIAKAVKKHHMIDLETLDTKPSAIVVSIGIVEFDPETFAVSRSLYSILEMGEQLHWGRTKSADTVAWWDKQSEEAKSVFKMPRTPVNDVLDSLDNILTDTGGVWGNGADFDCVIVGSLYDTFRRKKPWSFGKNRCFRTVKNSKLPKEYVEPTRLGTHHNALDDAVFQLAQLSNICQATGLRF